MSVRENRRSVLRTLGAIALSSCASGDDTGSNEVCGDPPMSPSASTGWIEVPLTDYPDLRTPGSAAPVRIPAAFLDVIVVHTVEDCFLATWRICPHGACTVEHDADAHELRCPCHGSRFAEDGHLLQGPAMRPLVNFPAVRVDDSIFIKRTL